MAKFGVAIGYAGGRAIVSEPDSAPEPSAFTLPVNILIEPPSIASQLPVMDEAYKHWKKCEKEALSANLHTIQDLQIGKAILTTNFGNYCDPSVEPVKLFNRQRTRYQFFCLPFYNYCFTSLAGLVHIGKLVSSARWP